MPVTSKKERDRRLATSAIRIATYLLFIVGWHFLATEWLGPKRCRPLAGLG